MWTYDGSNSSPGSKKFGGSLGSGSTLYLNMTPEEGVAFDDVQISNISFDQQGGPLCTFWKIQNGKARFIKCNNVSSISNFGGVLSFGSGSRGGSNSEGDYLENGTKYGITIGGFF